MGNYKWGKILDADLFANRIIINSDGNIFWVGAITVNEDSNISLIKFDNNGEIKFARSFGGSKNDMGNSITESVNGKEKCLLTGGTYSTGNGDLDGLILQIDNKGNVNRYLRVGGKLGDTIFSVINKKNNGYVFVGTSASYDSYYHDVLFCETETLLEYENSSFSKVFLQKALNVASENYQFSSVATDIDQQDITDYIMVKSIEIHTTK